MSFDVSTLSNYTKANESELVSASLFDAKTMQLIQSEGTVIPDVKSSVQINVLDTDAVFQAGGTCGFSASGTTTFTNRTLSVGKIKINESLCPKSLESKYLQLTLTAGSRYEGIPFEKQYSDRKAAKVAKALEVALWQGDTASGNAQLNKFDGLIKIIDGAASAVAVNNTTYLTAAITAAGGGIKESNVRDLVNGMWKAIPADLKGKDDVRIFCGWDTYEKYIAALISANLFAYTAANGDQPAGEIKVPGTQYTLTAVHGLDGTNRLFALRMSNIYYGVDVVGEENRFEIFFAKEADEVRYVNEFKAGVQVAFPAEITQFTLG